jgi:hypothetical protein
MSSWKLVVPRPPFSFYPAARVLRYGYGAFFLWLCLEAQGARSPREAILVALRRPRGGPGRERGIGRLAPGPSHARQKDC